MRVLQIIIFLSFRLTYFIIFFKHRIKIKKKRNRKIEFKKQCYFNFDFNFFYIIFDFLSLAQKALFFILNLFR